MPGLTQTNATVGARPSISDTIFLTDSEETPLFALLKKVPGGSNPIEQHPADTPGYAPGRGKPDNKPAGAAVNQSKNYGLIESNYHWFELPVSAGKKAQTLVNRAGVGRKKLYAREVAKGILALRTKIDRALSDSEDQRDEEGSNGSETRGLGSWIQAMAQGVRPVAERFRPQASSILEKDFSDITEQDFGDTLTSIFTATGANGHYVGLVGPQLKRLISSWSIYTPDKPSKTVVRNFNAEIKGKTLRETVDIIESDFGTIELHPSRNIGFSRDYGEDELQPLLGRRTGYIFKPDDYELKVAQDVQHKKLPDNNSGEAGVIDAILAMTGTPTRSGKVVGTGN